MVHKGYLKKQEIAFETGDIYSEKGVTIVHNARKIGELGADYVPDKIKLGDIRFNTKTKAQIKKELRPKKLKNKKNYPKRKLTQNELQQN
jgi:hypothetical protein